MKNKKGFTLVELLAAIVILGLLITFAFPTITRMIFKSREKIYIADAQKLVAQAEYKLRANNTEIEKPDPGNCIVISLLYLDNQDFENSPYEGAYQREKSFVVVKNTGSELQYSVMLVEKKKDGNYRGVYLVTNDKLYSSGSTSLVVDFDEDELVYVESIDALYINNYLGGDYIDENGEISAIYNNAVIADESVVDESSPRIMSAKLVSSSKPFNTLDATLTLKAEDGDTPLSDLMVYLSTTNYQEVNGEPYGDAYTSFFHDFDFSTEGYTIGSRITLYVLVKDPDGNKDRKKIIYDVHSNTAPVIDSSSSVTKRSSDPFASLTGVLTLNVEDDYDSLTSLQVCLDDSINSDPITECNNYQSYSSIFDSNNQTEYTFTNCNGPCARDGLTHYLAIFVKDTMGLVSSKTLTYDTTANAAPTFTESVTVTSKEESFSPTGSKNVTVRVRASDDADSLGHLKVSINDGVSGVVEYDMRDNEDDNNFDYVIVGSYDGSTRDITVTVTDSEGQSTSQTVSYVLYRDISPTINSFNVESADVPCILQSWCPGDNGGSKNALFTADITDDLDSVDELMVCVSENEADCIVEEATGNEPEGYNPFINEHYVSYSEYYGKHVAITANASSYDGSTHTFYLYVVDSFGNKVHDSFEYKIYENQPPLINYLKIVAAGVDKFEAGSLHIKLDIMMEDDFDTIDNMLVDIVDNDNTIASNQPLTDFIDGTQIIHLGGTYDGSVHNINVTVRDSYGAGVNQLTEYQIYKDSPPVIDSFRIYSREPACKNPLVCPVEMSGNYQVYYEVDAFDDFGDDGVSVCVSESETCTDYQPLSNFKIGDESVPIEYIFTPIDPNNPYDGSTRKLYVFAKDSVNSEIVQDSATYKIYKKQPPKIFMGPSYHGYRDENNMALPIVWYEIVAAADNDDPDDPNDDLQIQYCYTKNSNTTEHCTSLMPYTSRYVLNNSNFFHQTSYNGRNIFNIYAKLVDTDGATTEAEPFKFMPFLDNKPVIESVDAVPATGKNIDVTFLVSDYNDTYQVCISKTDSCDEDDYLTTVYDGTDKQYHTITFKNNDTNTSNVTLYFFVRDSRWNTFDDQHIVSTSVVSNPYTQCSQPNYNKKPKVQYTYLPDKTYSIVVKDDNGKPIPILDENGDPVLDGSGKPVYETVTYSNQEISMDRCSGKCFESNPVSGDSTSNIFGYYNKTITYYDRFSPNVFCSSNPVATEYEATCAFKECFKKNNNYNRQNIFGAYLFHDDVEWTISINGRIYTNHSHYKRYTSSYTDGDEEITLTEVPNTNGICPKCVEDGLYDFNINDNEPYIRISENINDPFFEGGSQ